MRQHYPGGQARLCYLQCGWRRGGNAIAAVRWNGDAMRRIATYTCLLLLLGVGACTQANIAELRAGVGSPQPVSASLGTIVSMRPVTETDAGNPLQAVLLADASGAAPPSNAAGRPIMEFIVRQDDGGIISVVQSNEAGFRPGDRVSILRGDRIRLVRPG